MTELIEFDPADAIGAGAFGAPGQRTFVVQARRGTDSLSVLIEKEQARVLANEALRFLERLELDHPETAAEEWRPDGSVREAEPLFRARMMGIGFDPRRGLVVIELREWPDDEPPEEDLPARVARLFATRAQVRAMASHALSAVESGRPSCPLCDLPMDPEGHWCPRWN